MKTIVIIGGGAAGLMAAISASYEKKKVILLEKNEKLGKKLYITGKGRCNITTSCPPEDFLSGIMTNPRFLHSAFHRFNNEAMMRFLTERGLKIKIERGMRVFPESDHSSDVIRLLKEECLKHGVKIRYHSRVTGIHLDPEKGFRSVELENGEIIQADSLVLACGGRSYPSTGSNGDGYKLAESLGHTIKTPEPSLVPFVMKESWCKDLMGLSLKNVSIRLKDGKKTVYEGFGEFLFTHFGVSGPLVLTASTKLGKYQKALKEGRLVLVLDLKPSLTEEQLEKRFLREFDTFRNKDISNVIDTMLPRKMVPVFLAESGIDPHMKVRDISKANRRRMMELMKGWTMKIEGLRGFEEAIVTRGGIHVKEVNPTTMESKIVPGVFFAGEILDVDGVTGGYNLQIAWSTGYTAGFFA
ncbi:MAG: NAD(P)/FAD-dependent oxidoreductase [Eubacterium sp.]|nr:NAD(P)/FAD-dependent oxidoreductase [Eubacterium sp.]